MAAIGAVAAEVFGVSTTTPPGAVEMWNRESNTLSSCVNSGWPSATICLPTAMADCASFIALGAMAANAGISSGDVNSTRRTTIVSSSAWLPVEA